VASAAALPPPRAARTEEPVSKLKSLRLDAPLLARVESIAKEYGMEFSTAVRWLLKRGCAAAEAERVSPPAPPEMARRRVISKGVG
jgi:hypothetical protein